MTKKEYDMSYGKITPKQQEILEFIKESILNRGYPTGPSVRFVRPYI